MFKRVCALVQALIALDVKVVIDCSMHQLDDCADVVGRAGASEESNPTTTGTFVKRIQDAVGGGLGLLV